MKKFFSIICIILAITVLASAFLSCNDKAGGNTAPTENKQSPNYPIDNDQANDGKKDVEISLYKEYYSIDYTLHEAEMVYLKKVCLDENEQVTTIYYYGRNSREDFYYTDGRLEYSETFSLGTAIGTGYNISIAPKKLYETRYVYEGDRIVRSEVLYNGYKTLCYDELEYTEDGALKTVIRYERGEISDIYHYNGKKRPESIQNYDRVFVPEYDERGNVISVDVSSESILSNCYTIEVQYTNNTPSYTLKRADGEGKYVLDEVFYAFYHDGTILDISKVTSYCNPDGTFYNASITGTTHYNDQGRVTLGYRRNLPSLEILYDSDGVIKRIMSFDNAKRVTIYDVKLSDTGKLSRVDIYEDDSTTLTSFWEYNENGYPVRYVRYLSEPAEKEAVYEYYPNGIMKKKTVTNKDITVVYTYSENGNLLTRDYGGLSFIEYVDTELCYGFERLSTAYNTDYESKGCLKRRVTSSNGRVEEYEYDELYSYITKLTQYLPDGRTVIQVKSEDKKSVTLTEYDKDGNIIYQTVNEVREFTDGYVYYG